MYKSVSQQELIDEYRKENVELKNRIKELEDYIEEIELREQLRYESDLGYDI